MKTKMRYNKEEESLMGFLPRFQATGTIVHDTIPLRESNFSVTFTNLEESKRHKDILFSDCVTKYDVRETISGDGNDIELKIWSPMYVTSGLVLVLDVGDSYNIELKLIEGLGAGEVQYLVDGNYQLYSKEYQGDVDSRKNILVEYSFYKIKD